jgi:hypothetical protein
MKTSSPKFTTFDIREKLGLKIDRLKDWMQRGYIEPSIQRADGIGTKNIFSLFDLYLIKLFHHLVSERGFSRENAGTVIRDINKEKIKIQSRPLIFIGIPGMGKKAFGFNDLSRVEHITDMKDIDILIVNFSVIQEIVNDAIER